MSEEAGGSNAVEGSSGSKLPSVQQLTADMMRNPAILNLLQQQLGTIVGSSSGYVETLPKSIQRRIHALKNLQMESSKIESKFYEEVHELERKYSSLYNPLFEKRSEIVTGMYEPMEEECTWEGESIEIEETQAKKRKEEEAESGKGESCNPKGIPSFWLTIFKNVPATQEMIKSYDEPVLESLADIKVGLSAPGEPMAFTLDFHFNANDFFTDRVLTKKYDLQAGPDEDSPFSFEGPQIVSCSGCEINWKKGMNVTVETASLKQGKITETPRSSFFNFFNPPKSSDDEEEMDADVDILNHDFEIGHLIRDRIVPCAVLYFTGEADQPEESDDEEEEEKDEDEEEDDDDDAIAEAGSGSDSDPDFELDENAKENPQSCKQQ